MIYPTKTELKRNFLIWLKFSSTLVLVGKNGVQITIWQSSRLKREVLTSPWAKLHKCPMAQLPFKKSLHKLTLYLSVGAAGHLFLTTFWVTMTRESNFLLWCNAVWCNCGICLCLLCLVPLLRLKNFYWEISTFKRKRSHVLLHRMKHFYEVNLSQARIPWLIRSRTLRKYASFANWDARRFVARLNLIPNVWWRDLCSKHIFTR